jgi:radical SAM superfamily enzyme YgiQ (UPF0313 family)
VLIGGPGSVTKTSRRDIFKIFDPDYIVHHEGELALFDALDMIESGKRQKKPNLSFKEYDGNSVPIKDLDLLALPDFSQYGLDDFFLPVRVLPIMTSRGCPWSKCAFCNHHATYRGYRVLSPGRVAETVENYKREYKTDMIMLHDETFTADRAKNMIDELPEAYYYSYAYPRGFDYKTLKKMYDKGFRVLVWGVESGCQETLDRMNKGTKVSEIRGILKDSSNAGITNVVFIMFGFPGETEKQANETVRFLSENSDYIERHASTQFRLEENSPVWMQPAEWGVVRHGFDYEVKEGMDREETSKFLKDLNRRNLKTAKNTKYYMPGDSEMRAYFFMQVVYGENEGEFPVRNGILAGDTIWPSLLMNGVSRPRLVLNEKQKKAYEKCDGRHKVNARDFEEYPYVV